MPVGVIALDPPGEKEMSKHQYVRESKQQFQNFFSFFFLRMTWHERLQEDQLSVIRNTTTRRRTGNHLKLVTGFGCISLMSRKEIP